MGVQELTKKEAAEILEDVLDVLVEVGNGTTDEQLQEACDKLFKFRDGYFNLVGALILSFFLSLIPSNSFAAKGQINLVGPTAVQVNSGWSSWSTKLSQPIQVNPLQVSFWNDARCPAMPITNISVKYTSDPYWYNTTYKDRFYYVENSLILEGIKLDFYLNGPPEACVISIYGYREIGGGVGLDEND